MEVHRRDIEGESMKGPGVQLSGSVVCLRSVWRPLGSAAKLADWLTVSKHSSPTLQRSAANGAPWCSSAQGLHRSSRRPQTRATGTEEDCALEDLQRE
jgi:hypothetical protein